MTVNRIPPVSEAQIAKSALARHGKSFFWAGKLMQPAALNNAALLYAFCRQVDDAVDLAPTPELAKVSLARIQQALDGRPDNIPLVRAVQQLAARHSFQKHWLRDLLEGVGADIGPVHIHDECQLLGYCYRVAGTVGAMMCPIIGATDRRATAFAIDLGIAMQLTNICRDVLEDATLNRVYVPQAWLAVPVSAKALQQGDLRQQAEVTNGVLRMLELADVYYRSADQGMRFIPLRNRLAIVTAARLYHAIGDKIRRKPERIWQQRLYVSPLNKALRTVQATTDLLVRPALLGIGQPREHQRQLHDALPKPENRSSLYDQG